jgi:hypothetical protein
VVWTFWWKNLALSGFGTCDTSRKITGSIRDGIFRIFHWPNPSGRTVVLGSTRPLNSSEYQAHFLGGRGVKAAAPYGWQPYHLLVPVFRASLGLYRNCLTFTFTSCWCRCCMLSYSAVQCVSEMSVEQFVHLQNMCRVCVGGGGDESLIENYFYCCTVHFVSGCCVYRVPCRHPIHTAAWNTCCHNTTKLLTMYFTDNSTKV